MDYVLIPCPKCGKELKLRDRSLLGKTGKCPQCAHRFPLQEPEEVELELADGDVPVTGTSPQWVPDETPVGKTPAATAQMPAPSVVEVRQPATAGRRKNSAQQRRRTQLQLGAMIGGGLAAVIVVAVIWANVGNRKSSGPGESESKTASQAGAKDNEPPGLAENDGPQPLPEPPPQGEPIKLTCIPPGARMIIHLRPAEMWKAQSQAETVRFCLVNLGSWVDAKLKELLLFEPAEIEEVVICLFLDDRTRPPEIAYNVKLVDAQKPSTFIEKFQGKPNTEYGRKIYLQDPVGETPPRAFMITDQVGRGFASVPRHMAQDMVNGLEYPGLPAGGLEQLLKRTDDNRHVTVLFNPRDLRNFQQHLFPKNLDPLLYHFLIRFDDTKIESAAWSLYFGSDSHPDLHSELVLRNRTGTSPFELHEDMARKWKDLPKQLADLVRRMTPRIMAERKFVSRLPIMVEAFRVETVPTIGGENDRYVKLTTALPDIAGPNLAAATTWTWRLAAATDFSKPVKPSPGERLPELVADRLKKRIEIDFRRMPLQKALDYIAEETSVKSEIDGDALKDAGYTKNMPQTFKLGVVPATTALSRIIKQYPGMVVVVQEDKKQVYLTTAKFAKMKGLKPFPLKP